MPKPPIGRYGCAPELLKRSRREVLSVALRTADFGEQRTAH